MKKNTYLKIIGGVASTIALTTMAPASFALDYYAGVAGGVSSLTVKNDGTYTYDSTVWGGPGQGSQSSTGSATGATGEIYLGLATQPVGRLYLATELNFTGFTGSANTNYNDDDFYPTQGTTSFDSKVNYAFGISVLPGFVVSDKTLLYTRIGVNYMQFQSTPADNNQATFDSSIKEGVAAYRLGLGAERYITSNLSLRLEGDYWSLNKTNRSAAAASGSMLNQDFQPNIITGMIGLTYHFGAQSDSTAK